MSFSSGTFTLTTGNPVVTGNTVSSTWANNTLSDIATGLSTCLLKDGTQTATASISFAQGISVSTTLAAGTTTVALLNTTATTINAFGAATTLNIGNSGGTTTAAGNWSIGGTLGVTGASTLALFTASKNQNATSTWAIQNTDSTSSSSRTYFDINAGTTTLEFRALHGDHVYLLTGASQNIYLQPGGSTAVSIASTGAIQFNAYTATTWVSGDKYLVVDASGNIHRSAIGPAS